MPRVLLISLRDPHDPMALQERQCFAERAMLADDAIELHFMVQGRPTGSSLARYDAIFFGGSGAYSVLDDVPWIKQTLELLVRVVDRRIPAYASCFGFQGLAVALGGEVVRDDSRTEMGSTELTLTEAGRECSLFSTLPSPFWAQEGHHDVVTQLPEGVTLLASSALCEAQALRVDGAPFWASQFHPELNIPRTIERFRHYSAHYLHGDSTQDILQKLSKGRPTTPEVSTLLARFVRQEL